MCPSNFRKRSKRNITIYSKTCLVSNLADGRRSFNQKFIGQPATNIQQNLSLSFRSIPPRKAIGRGVMAASDTSDAARHRGKKMNGRLNGSATSGTPIPGLTVLAETQSLLANQRADDLSVADRLETAELAHEFALWHLPVFQQQAGRADELSMRKHGHESAIQLLQAIK